MSGTFAALTHPAYRRLWSGSTVAMVAFMMSFMLVPSVAFEITGSNTSAGLAQMGSGIGMLIVSPIGGVVADRVHKKPVVLAGQIVPGLVILAVGILIITDNITVPLLTIGTLIMGLGFSFMGPARQAWVAELVPKASLPNAIALQQLAQNIAQVGAPLCIALLVGTVVGTGGAYLFMASLFLVVLPLTLSLPNTEPVAKEPRSMRSEMVDGVRYVWSDLRLRTLWLGFMGIVVCGFAFQTLLPGAGRRRVGGQPPVGRRGRHPLRRGGPGGDRDGAGRRVRAAGPGSGLRPGAGCSHPHRGRAVWLHAGRQLAADVQRRPRLPRSGHVAGHDGSAPSRCWRRCGEPWPTPSGSG